MKQSHFATLYGGIHYRPAIYEGVKQGEAVGQYVIDQLKLRAQYTDATQ